MKSPRERIDPELAEALDAVPKGPAGIFDIGDIERTRVVLRQQSEAMAAATPADPSVSVEELNLRGTDGPDVPVRLLRPAASGPLAALLWFHGGGQVLGYAAQEDAFLTRICHAVGCVVVPWTTAWRRSNAPREQRKKATTHTAGFFVKQRV